MTYVNEGSVLGVGILFIILGTAAVTARIIIRVRTSAVGADDWFAITAWVFLMGQCGIMIYGALTDTIGGHSPPHLGLNLVNYTDRSQVLLEKLEFTFYIIQILTSGAIKLSVLLFYRRLFPVPKFKFWNSVLIVIVVAWILAFGISSLAQCPKNINSNFGTLLDLKQNCVDTFGNTIALVASDVAVDLVILAIPIPTVMSLQLPMKKRISIVLVLLLGMMATACGIARMALTIEILGPPFLSKPTLAGLPADDDIAIVSVTIFWGFLETAVAMVAICLPVMYRVIREISPWHLFVRIGTCGSRDLSIKPVDTSMEMNDMSRESGDGRVYARCTAQPSRRLSSDRESHKALVRDGQIWEHTKIMQTSETAHI